MSRGLKLLPRHGSRGPRGPDMPTTAAPTIGQPAMRASSSAANLATTTSVAKIKAPNFRPPPQRSPLTPREAEHQRLLQAKRSAAREHQRYLASKGLLKHHREQHARVQSSAVRSAPRMSHSRSAPTLGHSRSAPTLPTEARIELGF